MSPQMKLSEEVTQVNQLRLALRLQVMGNRVHKLLQLLIGAFEILSALFKGEIFLFKILGSSSEFSEFILENIFSWELLTFYLKEGMKDVFHIKRCLFFLAIF